MIKAISYLIPIDGFKKTLRRFSISSLSAVVLFVIVLMGIHDIIDFHEFNIYGRIALTAFLSYFACGVIKLLCESRHVGVTLSNIAGFIGLAIIFAMSFLINEGQVPIFTCMITVAFLLLIGTAPFIGSKDNLSIWAFNKSTWFGVKISILAGVIWGGGISAALASIGYLFEFRVDGELYADIWAFALIIFAPLYALSWVPEKFDFNDEECDSPPQLNFVLNWALAPLVVIYLLILYAYFVKILVEWELPDGHISMLVMGFGGVGILTYLAAWPIRNKGDLFTRILYKIFFPALLIPALMMAFAIYIRVSEYGITVERYTVILATIWFFIASIVFSVAQLKGREISIAILPILCAALLIVGSFGPWGAYQQSKNSQLNRLETMLIQHHILVNGKIAKTSKEISFEERKSITTTLQYLYRYDDDRRLKELLNVKPDEKVPPIKEVTEKMGFKPVWRWTRKDRAKDGFKLESPTNKQTYVFDVRGYDYYLTSHYKMGVKGKKGEWLYPANEKTQFPETRILVQNNILMVNVDNQQALNLDLKDIILREAKVKAYRKDVDLSFIGATTNYQVKINLRQLHGTKKDGQITNLNTPSFTLYLTRINGAQ